MVVKRPRTSSHDPIHIKLYNLNWQRFSPTFEIYNDSFNPHARRIVFFATILLKGLQVRNFPIKLKLQLSMASNLPSSEIGIISSSSIINFIFSNLSATSLSIMSHKKERITLRMLPRERELAHSQERERERERAPLGRETNYVNQTK